MKLLALTVLCVSILLAGILAVCALAAHQWGVIVSMALAFATGLLLMGTWRAWER